MVFDNKNTIAVRFTENVYATKAEVAHSLNTPLIDSFWKNIVKYRQQFAQTLPLSAVDRTTFLSFCYSPKTSEEINNVELKFINFVKRFNEINEQTNDKILYCNDAIVDILSTLASKYSLDVDVKYLKMLVSNNLKTSKDDDLNILSRYINALDFVSENIDKPIDMDYLANLYSLISNNHELVELYRSKNLDSSETRVLIDRLYTSAPVYAIDTMMNQLFKFINSYDGSISIKASAVFYYMHFIKPFNDFNDEMALLLTKAVILRSETGVVGKYLNLEKSFTTFSTRLNKVTLEVQKTNDLTYFLKFMNELCIDAIDEEIKRINNLEAIALKEDYYFSAQEEIRQAEINTFNHSSDADELPLDDNNEKEETKEPSIIKDDTANAESEQYVEEKYDKPIKENEESIKGLAISYLPPVLDERQASRLEEHLLESDPELSRSQAYFYARHCSMGKRYTIQQFKKEVGCAYETARTSMDNLAKLGYYRQEMVKNKKVYTPIKRK